MDGPRVLIFGGTFDPPHRAHTRLPPIAAARLRCDRIIYIPAALNPLKDDRPTPAAHRLEMLRRAIAAVPGAEIDTCELDREGPSYTVDTLEMLRERFGPGATLYLLMGSDQALEFTRWHRWRRILELATPAVMVRPPHTGATYRKELAARYGPDEARTWLRWTLDLPRMDIHATRLREALASGDGVDELLDPGVLRYVREHRLYECRDPEDTGQRR